MDFFFLNNAFHHVTEGEELPEGAVLVPRMPKDGETWDTEKGEFVYDDAAVADMTVSHSHKPEVYRFKVMEAALILSGVKLTHGFLAEEAEQLGLPLEELAKLVYDKLRETRELEVARRIRRFNARRK